MTRRAGQADFYPTPTWATRALLEKEQFDGEIWEPACGDGRMARVLAETGNLVLATDLNNFGFGETGVDFLASDRRSANIVTNPPFNLAEEFLAKALESARHKVALLLRLAFLEGAKRAVNIYDKAPPSRVWVLSERITMYPGHSKIAGNGTIAFAWFVWDKSYVGATQLGWIMPGLRAKFGA